MSKVYVVQSSSTDGYYIEGVFSRYCDAELMQIKAYNHKDVYLVEIFTKDLDARVKELK